MKTAPLPLMAVIAAVSFFGFGCGPRIVRVPPADQSATSSTSEPSDTEKPLAYLKLNGGAASITRGISTAAGQEDAELLNGDRIRVTSGTVLLVYADAGETQLDEGSDVTLVADGPETGDVFMELRVTAGDVWTRFERLLGTNEHFSVESNGVVATVRGTGFGVSVHGDDVDVQVAEHTVDVTSEIEEASATSGQALAAVHLVAGQAFRIAGAEFRRLGAGNAGQFIRSLSSAEKKGAGFLFGSRKIPLNRLSRPQNPVRLKLNAAALSAPLLQRIDLLKDRMLLETKLQGFAAPTRTVTSGELTPSSTPSVSGPTSTAP